MNELLSVLPTFALSLGLTLGLELLIALLFRLRGRELVLLLPVNLLTNPAAVYLNLLMSSLYPSVSALAWQLPLEALVVVVEGALYAKLASSLRKPWLFAVAANGFSYGVGRILSLILIF